MTTQAPGVANKTPHEIRQVIEDAVELVGGAERLAQWAPSLAEAETAFWTLVVPKILPRIIMRDPENPIPYAVIERVIAS